MSTGLGLSLTGSIGFETVASLFTTGVAETIFSASAVSLFGAGFSAGGVALRTSTFGASTGSSITFSRETGFLGGRFSPISLRSNDGTCAAVTGAS